MITEAYVSFFQELELNNHKQWFHEHKKRYETEVKKPFLDLLERLIPTLSALEPAIPTDAKSALFRINRDVRFSKDKTPYHILLKAGFSPGGKKSRLPGFYLGISATTIHVGGGLFTVQPTDLKAIRMLIANKPDDFMAIVTSDVFVSNFGELKGEKSKRLDKQLLPIATKAHLIANKQFYAMKELPVADYLNSEALVDVLVEKFRVINSLNQFLKEAFI